MVMGALFSEADVQHFSLEEDLAYIAREAGIISNLSETIKNVLPNFKSKFVDLSQTFAGLNKTRMFDFKSITSNQKTAIQNTKYLDYMIFGDYAISVPDGFNGDLIEYGNALKKNFPIVVKTANDALDYLDGILASFITNKDDSKVQSENLGFYIALKKEREHRQTDIKKFFSAAARGRSYGKAKLFIKRMADIKELVDLSNELSDDNHIAQIRALQVKVDHCASMMDMIIDQIKVGKLNNITPAAAKSITAGVFEVGKLVEDSGIYYFDIQTYLTTIDKLVNVINNSVE